MSITRPPIVSSQYEPAGELVLGDEMELDGLEVVGDFSGQEATDVEISGCQVRGSRMTGAHLDRFRAHDTTFERCDLSGAVFGHASFRRVEFRDCRLSGADISGAQLEDVAFVECRLDDANLRMITAARVRFDDCTMPGADMYGARLPDVRLRRCDLRGANVAKAVLRGARFHGSNIDGIVGAADLDDAAFDSGQLVPLALWFAAMAGISIDDDAADDE